MISTASPAATGLAATTNVGFDMPIVVLPPPNAKYVAGTTGNDVLTGSAAPEYFVSNGGYDRIDGGGEVDTVELHGKYTEFTLAIGSGVGTEIIGSRTVAGDIAALVNVERVQFSDCIVALNAGGGAIDAKQAAYAALGQKLYIAYFGRPADHFGLEAVVNELSKSYDPTNGAVDFLTAVNGSAALTDLVNSFGKSAESSALYNGSTTHFVTAIYQNVLGRAPDADGLAYWSQLIDSGKLSRPLAALNILTGAESNHSTQGLIDGQLLNNRVVAATNFNLAMDTGVEYAAYAGNDSAALARAMLALVDQNTNVLAFESTVLDTLRKIGPVQTTLMDHAGAVPVELVGTAQAHWAV